MDIKNIWRNQEIDSGPRTVREKLVLKNSIPVYIGRIGVSNAKMFQVEIDKDVPIHQNYLKRFSGVEIRVLDGVGRKKDVTIILSDNDLLEIFILFLEDLMAEIESVTNENFLPQSINKKVNYWGRLFAKIKSNLLSKERQRGLYGELNFLKILMNNSTDYHKCVMSWTGVEKTSQDFRNEAVAVEIKTSKATKLSITISNELQMDWTVFDDLYLVAFHLVEIWHGDETLMKIINQIKSMLRNHNDVLEIFNEKLDMAGIPEEEIICYDENGYVIRSVKSYKVSEGFPALTRSTISNEAIHNVKYQIDLTGCGPFENNINEVLNKVL